MFNENDINIILDLISMAYSESFRNDKFKELLEKIKSEYKNNKAIQKRIKEVEFWI